jgi:hypothetical protein
MRPSRSTSSAYETMPLCARTNSRTSPGSDKQPMPSVLVSTAALACDAACSTDALNRHSTCVSKCKRYILNAGPMLHTCTCQAAAAEAVVQMRKPHSERCTHAAHSRTQKIHPEGRVSVDMCAVSPQSRQRCVVDQPTCETVNASSNTLWATVVFCASSPRALSERNRCFRSFPPSSPFGETAKLNPFCVSAKRSNLLSTAETSPA